MHYEHKSMLLEIPRVADINYEEFVKKFLSKNLPCLLEERHTRTWRSRQEWISNGKPHFQFLKDNFGEASVPVADCSKKQYGSHPKQSMLFKDFIDYWKSDDGDTHKTSTNEKPNLYLKDWHFCKAFPHYQAYQTPPFFQSDWLNEFWDKWTEMKDDYRFVYMGPKGSWTPFHADVFRSYSWSANVCGHKKWIMYPPGAEKFLKDINGNLVFDVTSSETSDRKKFPDFEKAPKPLVVEQNVGEIIFVPSCWYHQVINEEDTISINHNWINGSGILRSWQHLNDELQLVKRSIDDCRSMDGWANQCQMILEANSGINFQGLFELLCSISRTRLLFLRTNLPKNPAFQYDLQKSSPSTETTSWNKPDSTELDNLSSAAKEYKFNTSELCLFDLQKVKDVLLHFTSDDDVDELLKQQAVSLLSYLDKVIDVSHAFQEN